ncbi:hypothetical protein AB0I60_05680 [Actinosynnema sp. NPDC050436]|uniref:YncE family protein n=1 Tax=Actinosynnema sp. NPDC050436 TaxID=3155659 RepID=UPI0033FBCC6F
MATAALMVGVAAPATATSDPHIDVVPLGDFTPNQSVVSPDGRFTYLSAATQRPGALLVKVVDNATRTLAATYAPEVPTTDYWINDLTISSDGNELYVLTAQRVAVLDARTGDTETTIPLPPSRGQFTGEALASVGRALLVADQADFSQEVPGRLLTIDLARSTVVAELDLKRAWVGDLLVAPDQHTVHVTTGGYRQDVQKNESAIETYDVGTGTLVSDLVLDTPPDVFIPLGHSVLGKDGRRLYGVHLRQDLMIVDHVQGKLISTTRLTEHPIAGPLALGTDEKQLYIGLDQATQDDGPTVAVADATTGTTLDTLTGFTDDWVSSLIVHPHGRTLHVGTATDPGTNVYQGALQITEL